MIEPSKSGASLRPRPATQRAFPLWAVGHRRAGLLKRMLSWSGSLGSGRTKHVDSNLRSATGSKAVPCALDRSV